MDMVTLMAPAPTALNEDGAQKRIVGDAFPIGQWGNIGYFTRIRVTDRQAFDGALDDVVLNAYQHQSAAMARTKAGNLRLELRDEALSYESLVNDRDTGFRDAYERVKSGVIDGASIGFNIAPDGSDFELGDDGVISQTVTNVRNVFEITLTESPVMKRTSAVGLARPALDGELAALQIPKALLDDQRRILSGGRGRPPDFTARVAAMAAWAQAGG